MSQAPKVLFWGLGAMGGGMAAMALDRESLDVVAAIEIPERAGKDLGEVLGREKVGVTVTDDPDTAFARAPDVALICTSSFAKDVFPRIKFALEKGANVITIAEEMAFPWASQPDLAAEMDSLATKAGKTVLGTGINPGFVLDTLVISLTGVCRKVNRIHAKRVNDLSPFGPTVMKTQGVGTTVQEFKRGLETKEIVGHIGFPQSIGLIARALNWDIDEVVEEREPIVSKVERKSKYAKVEPGNVAGCRHTARAFSRGKELIFLEHPQQICPEAEGVETGDYVTIDGDPPLHLSIKPEIPGGTGTIAIAVNMIPLVISAKPGLLTMADLPVPRSLFS
jgi:hypothetical protein